MDFLENLLRKWDVSRGDSVYMASRPVQKVTCPCLYKCIQNVESNTWLTVHGLLAQDKACL